MNRTVCNDVKSRQSVISTIERAASNQEKLVFRSVDDFPLDMSYLYTPLVYRVFVTPLLELTPICFCEQGA